LIDNPLPGLPLIESPLFGALLPSLGLNDEETRIGFDLHSRGYAVLDLPTSARAIRSTSPPRTATKLLVIGAFRTPGASTRM
jgi:hypothetical protein